MFSIYTTPSFYAPVAPQPTFTALFRLLDDFDTYSRGVQHCQPRYHQRRQRQPQVFKPRFDARETETSYELHGDLPGVSKEHLDIQFTGPQTLVVKGRVVRTYELNKPEIDSEPQQPEAAATSEPAQTTTESQSQPEAEKKDEFVVVNNHHATVEDDPEEESIGTLSVRSASPVSTPTETPRTEVAKPAPAAVTPASAETQKSDDKVWVFERTVGEFERTFNFPGRVDQEAVSATLENGVLTISVPKARTPVTRRIVIN